MVSDAWGWGEGVAGVEPRWNERGLDVGVWLGGTWSINYVPTGSN